MATKDPLGERLKSYYENVSKTSLTRRTPVALRIDGKAFHTFTRKLKRPFDEILIKSMQDTMKYLCANIQGCVLGYTQSDEITLILIDYQKLDTAAWFDYKVQKMCSVAASMATNAFNRAFMKYACAYVSAANAESVEMLFDKNYAKALQKAMDVGAEFDCRAFNIPKEEVTNLVYWRQCDASKNSIQMVARAYFSHRELKNKKGNDMQDMLHEQFGVNWNDFPTEQKRGSACIRNEETRKWEIDHEMPILKGEGREYVEKLIYIDR